MSTQHTFFGKSKLRSTCSICKITKRNAVEPTDVVALHRITKDFDQKHAHPEAIEPEPETEPAELIVAEIAIEPPPSPPIPARLEVPAPPPSLGRGARIAAQQTGRAANLETVTGSHANPTRMSAGGAARITPPAPSAVTAGAARSGTTRIGSR